MSGLTYGTYGASTTIVIIGLCMRNQLPETNPDPN